MRKIQNYTFIEIMVVVIIIAILAAVVMPKFAGRTEDARISSAQSQLSIFQTALSTYNLDTGKYPTTQQGLKALVEKPSSPPVPSTWKGPYLQSKKIPKDPWKNPYIYKCPGKHNTTSYDLYSYGPDGQQGGDDDITNW
ncbi:MAG: type II secretion system major pseudopilin GspG [Victivallales bacterium]|nr:type II secretion system major pseudopilin GspG [Victivallales bacterium]MCF7888772.1 type II secretion system major pseudopilin GspG [Victivallales bacterium]